MATSGVVSSIYTEFGILHGLKYQYNAYLFHCILGSTFSLYIFCVHLGKTYSCRSECRKQGIFQKRWHKNLYIKLVLIGTIYITFELIDVTTWEEPNYEIDIDIHIWYTYNCDIQCIEDAAYAKSMVFGGKHCLKKEQALAKM